MWRTMKVKQMGRGVLEKTLTAMAMGLLILAGVARAQPAPAPMASAGGDASLVTQLMTETGLSAEKDFLLTAQLPAEMFTHPFYLMFIGVPSSQVDLVNKMYEGTFDAEEFYALIQQRFEKNMNGQLANKALNFFSTHLGRRVLEMESAFQRETVERLGRSRPALLVYRKEMAEDERPTGKRLELIARIARAMGQDRYDIEILRSILQVVAPLNDYFDVQPVEVLLEELEADLADYSKTLRVAMLARQFRDMKREDLERFARFAESPAGRWYYQTLKAGFMDGQKAMNRKAAKRIRQAVRALEEGRQDTPIFKKLFPPGLRYLFTRKRDPFVSLLRVRKALEEEKEKEAPEPERAERFGEELKELETIPLELYKSIREIDPELYDKLEFYAQLFRERQELEALTDDEYFDEVATYKDLITQANDLKKEHVWTPLQSGYPNLTLVGTVQTSSERIALVQTSDTKGYSVRLGMLVGPNFGVVEDIEETRIRVVERRRDFEGNILSDTVFIEYPGLGE